MVMSWFRRKQTDLVLITNLRPRDMDRFRASHLVKVPVDCVKPLAKLFKIMPKLRSIHVENPQLIEGLLNAAQKESNPLIEIREMELKSPVGLNRAKYNDDQVRHLMELMPKLSRISIVNLNHGWSIPFHANPIWSYILERINGLEKLTILLASPFPRQENMETMLKLSNKFAQTFRELDVNFFSGNDPSGVRLLLTKFPKLTHLRMTLNMNGDPLEIIRFCDAIKRATCGQLINLNLSFRRIEQFDPSQDEIMMILKTISQRWPQLKNFNLNPYGVSFKVPLTDIMRLYKKAEKLEFYGITFILPTKGEEEEEGAPSLKFESVTHFSPGTNWNVDQLLLTLNIFPSLKFLRSIRLNFNTEESLNRWAVLKNDFPCKNLRSLDIDISFTFSDKDFQLLSKGLKRLLQAFPKLRHLHLELEEIRSREALKHLCSIIDNCSRLEHLSLRNGCRVPFYLSDLPKIMPSLRRLRLYPFEPTNGLEAYLSKNYPKLQLFTDPVYDITEFFGFRFIRLSTDLGLI
jgi:hypothetical protein